MAGTNGENSGDEAPSTPSPQATRVESLFHLVQAGSCIDVRKNAAEKLGDIALQSPVYCRAILQKIRTLLVDPEWDVRVASAKCLDVIARSIKTECDSVAVQFAHASFVGREASCPRLNFRTVDMATVLRDGAPLLRSGGEEYTYQSNLTEDQRRVHAVRQRQLLLRRICGASGTSLWKSGEDTLAQQMLPRLNSEHVKELAEDIEASELAQDDTPESVPKDDTRKRPAEMLPTQYHGTKKVKIESNDKEEPAARDATTLEIATFLVADLFESVFDAKWEVRHGSFAALRHILLSSGLIESVTRENESRVVDQWIEECLIRCLCVLALDRFVDYSVDGSVAPVRELAAQVFGILLGSLHEEQLLQEYISVLRKLLGAPSWHTSHGGLLGIKYLLQAHVRHAGALVPLVIDDVVAMLDMKHEGAEEDVLIVASTILGSTTSYLRSVSSATLETAARSLWTIVRTRSSFVSGSAIQTLRLWYESSSVASVVEGHSDAKRMWENLSHIVPLLHHEEKSVRASTATCIKALVCGRDRPLAQDACTQDCLRYLLTHLLLQLLRDEVDECRRVMLTTWGKVIEWCACADRLVDVVQDRLTQWIELVWSLERVSALNTQLKASQNRSISSSNLLPSEENLAGRVAYAEALGILLSHLPTKASVYENVIDSTMRGLNSLSGEHQSGSLLLLYWWALHAKNRINSGDQSALETLRERVGDTLEALAQRDWVPQDASLGGYYSEQATSLQRILRMQKRLVEIFESAKIQLTAVPSPPSMASAAAVSRTVAEQVSQLPFSKLASQPQAFEQAHFCRQDLFLIDDVLQQAFARTCSRVQGIGSCAYCELLLIPAKKSGFLVKALMESIKTEEEPTFRALTAATLARFVESQVDIQRKCVGKVVSNLCNSAVALAYKETGQDDPTNEETSAFRALQVRVQGAEKALQVIASALESLECLPLLANVVTRGQSVGGEKCTDKMIQENAHLVAVLVSSLGNGAVHFAVQWVEELCGVLGEQFAFEQTRRAVAIALARVCGVLSTSDHPQQGEEAMAILYGKVFSVHTQGADPSALSGESRRLLAGSIMVLDRLVVEMKANLTSYVPSLLHFAMKAMHAADAAVRSMAAKAFADLLPLMPLQMDLSCADVKNRHLKKILQDNQSSRAFLEGLLQGKAIGTVSVSGVLAKTVQLREYQQHGVNWLTFLAQNQMGGVLADDMGLGKTLQVLATIANMVTKPRASRVSLIVCPPIIVHHWITEAKRYLPGVFAHVVDYSGPAAKRKPVLVSAQKTKGPVLLVSTYSVVRSDRDVLKTMTLDFVVLDEAHLIRNPKSSLFEAVCSLHASHRFVLSGTPLQNHVGDLWALFSFLMPGYLGDYADFRRDFELPISRSRERNATPKQKELAAHAINTLHQRVLPFILRRTKDEVLKELPPKIISNVLLPLTPLQQRLYKACSKTEDQADGVLPRGVLRHLQLLKKICVHPVLVKDDKAVMTEATAGEQKTLANWKHSGKMTGLRDLLVESCDVGRDDEDGDATGRSHRCLVFAHFTETLDVVQDMLAHALPNVTYLRLDGKTPIAKRQDVVTKFNDDPSIDLLLLTTAVGGLGLTLTGADTVVFIEHSWNPFVDLQAMDRAHRLGQTKTVRVFRLIMEASLEEHIMDLQAFKEQVAHTVVASTEASTSMNANTKNVLHLLRTSSTAVKAQAAAQADATGERRRDERVVGVPGVAVELLSHIGELWDQSQYDSLAFPSTTP